MKNKNMIKTLALFVAVAVVIAQFAVLLAAEDLIVNNTIPGDGTDYVQLYDCNGEQYFDAFTKTQNNGVIIQFDLVDFESTGGWFAVQKGLSNAGFSYNEMLYFTPTTMNVESPNTSFHFMNADGSDTGGNSIAVETPVKNTTYKFEYLADGSLNIYWASIGQPLQLRYTAPVGSFTATGPGYAGIQAAWGVKSLAFDNFSVKEIDGSNVFSTNFSEEFITDGADKNIATNALYKYIYVNQLVGDGTRYLALKDCNSEQYFMPVAKTQNSGTIIQFDLVDFERTGGWFAIQKGLANTGFSLAEMLYFTPTTMNVNSPNTSFHFFRANGTDTGGNSIAINTPVKNTTFKFEYFADGSLKIYWASIGQPLQLKYTTPIGSFTSVGPGNAGIQAAWGVNSLAIDNLTIKEIDGSNVFSTNFGSDIIVTGANKNLDTNATYVYVPTESTDTVEPTGPIDPVIPTATPTIEPVSNKTGDGTDYFELINCNGEEYFNTFKQTKNSGAIIQFDLINFERANGWFAIQKGLPKAGFSLNDMILLTPTVMEADFGSNKTFHFFEADGTDTGGNNIAVDLPTKNTTFMFEFLADGSFKLSWAAIGQPLQLRYTAPSGSFTSVGPGNAGIQAAWGVKSLAIDNFSLKEINGSTVFSTNFSNEIITAGPTKNIVTNASYKHVYVNPKIGDSSRYMELKDSNGENYFMPLAKTTRSGAIIQFDLVNYESTGGWFAIQKALANTGFTQNEMLLFSPTVMEADFGTNKSFHFFDADGIDKGGNNIGNVCPTKNTTFKFEYFADGSLKISWAPIGQPLQLRYTAPKGSFTSVGPGNAGIQVAYGVKSFAIDNFSLKEIDGTIVFSTNFENDLITDGVNKNVDINAKFIYVDGVDNPGTGDNLNYFIILLLLSSFVIGINVITRRTKKSAMHNFRGSL